MPLVNIQRKVHDNIHDSALHCRQVLQVEELSALALSLLT